MAFPEGQRSPDGHLKDFKGGVFAMAIKTGVPIVPITISHTHAIMPANTLFPVQSGADKLHVHVHEAIETEGKTDEELNALVRETFMKSLPLEQHPLESISMPDASAKAEGKEIVTASSWLDRHAMVGYE